MHYRNYHSIIISPYRYHITIISPPSILDAFCSVLRHGLTAPHAFHGMPRQVVGQFANEVPSSIAPPRKAFQHLGWLNSAAMDGHMGMPWGWMGRSWIPQKKCPK